jgi:nuclear GTP-binding protein
MGKKNSNSGKKKERAVNVSGKPRHSLDVNRPNDKKGAGAGGGAGGSRSATTVRRLQMYKLRPKRDRGGKIVKHDMQSKELPNTRIEPDRRWFGEPIPTPTSLFVFFRVIMHLVGDVKIRLLGSFLSVCMERC